MHKILPFDLHEMPPPSSSDHRVNLVRDELDHTPIVKDITLQELYDNHTGPGKFLYMAQTVSKSLSLNFEKLRDEKVPERVNSYAIAAPRNVKTMQFPKIVHNLGPLKEIHVTLFNPCSYVKEVLERAYRFIGEGSPVEFHVRLVGEVVRKKMKSAPASPEALQWMHKYFPHLRPDFILRSMPDGTEFLIKPVSDGRSLTFVMARETQAKAQVDLTTRVFKVKTAVTHHLNGGLQQTKQRWTLGMSEVKPADAKPARKKSELDGLEGEYGVFGETRDVEEHNSVEEATGIEQASEEEQARRDALAKYRGVKTELHKWRKRHTGGSGMDKGGSWKKRGKS
jgi:hypothetical protein